MPQQGMGPYNVCYARRPDSVAAAEVQAVHAIGRARVHATALQIMMMCTV